MIDINIQIPLDYNLDATFDCGQTFRWQKIEGLWTGIIKYGAVRVQKHESDLFIQAEISRGITEHEFSRYFQNYLNLDFDFEKFRDIIVKRDIVHRELHERILNFSGGMRILRQDITEVITAYIFSIQSNIKLISKRLDSLSSLFEQNSISFFDRNFYLFPDIDQLKTLDDSSIKGLRLGFREKYFRDLIINMSEEYLKKILITKEYDRLKRIKGIGEKVLSCIKLFACSDDDSIPVDVWIKRFLTEHYKDDLYKFKQNFSPYGGVYQEYIYRWIRNEKNNVRNSLCNDS